MLKGNEKRISVWCISSFVQSKINPGRNSQAFEIELYFFFFFFFVAFYFRILTDYYPTFKLSMDLTRMFYSTFTHFNSAQDIFMTTIWSVFVIFILLRLRLLLSN